ncbi:transcriptional regulator [Candidatus Saccharibacteria bacterium]|nr:MAG: transcriptional regulator [Candidatus Saccharibacteria bacterium]
MTERQAAILAMIIEQYAEIAAPVGSVTLAKLFGVSSATIRSEMSKLEDMGYIMQPHTSAGRIPTDKGYRFYVNRLSEESDMDSRVADRSVRAIEARVSNYSDHADRAIRSAVDTLAEVTHNLGIATIGDQLYMSGISNLFSQPEFVANPDSVQQIARLLDNLEPWLREAAPNEPLNVFIGSENPVGKSSQASLVISRFCSPYSDRSYIGVLGPTRQDYMRVMRLVKSTGSMLEGSLR